MTTVGVLPGQINIDFRPGNAFPIELTFPDGALTGAIFSSVVGETDLTPYMAIVDDVLTITVPADVTEEITARTWWALTLNDNVIIVGWWQPSTGSNTCADGVSGTITISDGVSVTVDLMAPLPGPVGPPGPGLAPGGTTGQVLYKVSGTNFDTGWETLTPGIVGADPAGSAAAVQTNLDTEVARATGVESGLDTRIDSIEALGPLATDADLDAETTAREAADTAFGIDLANEVIARADNDNLEIARATAAEALLIPLAQKGAANGVTPLGADSKINPAYLPAISITETFVVANQAAMLALSAQQGDIAIRTDEMKTYVLAADPATVLANWTWLQTPADTVTSVDGRQGIVTLSDLYDAAGAAAAAQAFSVQRANHTGTQLANTISNFNAAALSATSAAYDASGDAASAQAFSIQRANHTGTQSADTLTDGTTNKAFLATERTKLAGIATGATANSTDAFLLARANHTGTQLANTISDFAAAVAAVGDAAYVPKVGAYATSGTNVFSARVTGDSFDRYAVTPGGLALGSGAIAADVTLARTGAATATLTGVLTITGGLTSQAGISVTGGRVNVVRTLTTDSGYTSSVTGDANSRFLVASNGDLSWGPGTTVADTFLGRSATGTLRTTTTLQAQRAAAGNIGFCTAVNGDTVNRWAISADGTQTWGSGAAVADTTLARTGVGTLGLTGALTVSSTLTASVGFISQGSSVFTRSSGANQAWGAQVSGDTVGRVAALASGTIQWSDGTAVADVILSRSGVGALRLDSSFQVLRASSSNAAFFASQSGDANNRFAIRADGRLDWGDGTAVADTTLARSGVGALSVTGSLTVSNSIASNRGASGNTSYSSTITGNAVPSLVWQTGGALAWSDGTAAADVSLGRTAPGVLTLGGGLATTGGVTSSGGIIARASQASQSAIGAYGPATEACITLGSAADTALYRSAAGVFATTGRFRFAASASTLTDPSSAAIGIFDNNANIISSSASLGWQVTTYSDTTAGQNVFQRARNTQASPQPPQNSDTLGGLSFRGWNTASFTGSKASINASATETWTTTANGTSLQFQTTPIGSITQAIVAQITSAGVFQLSSPNTTTPLQATQAAHFQTTIGAAGGASALPATPTKYLRILDSSGVTLIIPCYAAV